MALISCSECGKEVSDKTASCPNCGAPTNKEKRPHIRRKSKKEALIFALRVDYFNFMGKTGISI